MKACVTFAEIGTLKQLKRGIEAVSKHHSFASVGKRSRQPRHHAALTVQRRCKGFTFRKVIAVHYKVCMHKQARTKHAVDIAHKLVEMLATVVCASLEIMHATISANRGHNGSQFALLNQAMTRFFVGQRPIREHMGIEFDASLGAKPSHEKT